ncbi:MAG TPA: hypothetical protein VFV49_17495 [Thermoanaerobaculia bacterium]|nr:hypothetical protein [Thermoanaerobaculia bacterium]
MSGDFEPCSDAANFCSDGANFCSDEAEVCSTEADRNAGHPDVCRDAATSSFAEADGEVRGSLVLMDLSPTARELLGSAAPEGME